MSKDISHELFVGALVSWMNKPRGGYGYVVPVDAKVTALSLDGHLADIEVRTKGGATVKRRVCSTKLRWRALLATKEEG